MKAVACAVNSLNIVDQNPVGSVHSLFRNSVNLQFGQRLIHLSAGNYGRLPFGLILESDHMDVLLKQIVQDEPVHWDEKHRILWFSQSYLYFSLADTSVYKSTLDLPKWNLYKELYDALLCTVVSKDCYCGLGMTAEKALIETGAIIGNSDGSSGLAGLQEAFYSDDSSLIERRLRFLIGRGAGLTPSGDDIIIGFLLGVTSARQEAPVFLSVLNRLIVREGLKLTTLISLEYLYYAGQRQFGSYLQDLMKALVSGPIRAVKAAARKVLEVGSTSGIDTLIGLITFLSMLEGAKARA